MARLNTSVARCPDSLVAGMAEARRASLALAVGAWAVWVCVALICETAGALFATANPSCGGAERCCCGPPAKGISKPANVRVIICSAIRRAAPKFFFVRRISLLIFFRGCWVKKCSGGVGGWR